MSKKGSYKGSASSPQYLSGSRDVAYYEQTQHRIRQQVYRKWGIRLAILLILGFAYLMWGDQIIRMIKREGTETASTFKKAGDNLKTRAEERAGKGLEDQ